MPSYPLALSHTTQSILCDTLILGRMIFCGFKFPHVQVQQQQCYTGRIYKEGELCYVNVSREPGILSVVSKQELDTVEVQNPGLGPAAQTEEWVLLTRILMDACKEHRWKLIHEAGVHNMARRRAAMCPRCAGSVHGASTGCELHQESEESLGSPRLAPALPCDPVIPHLPLFGWFLPGLALFGMSWPQDASLHPTRCARLSTCPRS